MKSFYDAGGTTTFVDRLASVLGIHASEIKVVSVYEGSLIVQFEITDPLDNSDNLKKIKTDMENKVAQDKVKLDLGAPILEFNNNGT